MPIMATVASLGAISAAAASPFLFPHTTTEAPFVAQGTPLLTETPTVASASPTPLDPTVTVPIPTPMRIPTPPLPTATTPPAPTATATPNPHGVITEYAVPAGSNPQGVTRGPDGNLWFAEYDVNQIDRVTPAGIITEYPLPTNTNKPYDITSGPDGNLWFTEYFKVGKLVP
jgi:streptogramin lyase